MTDYITAITLEEIEQLQQQQIPMTQTMGFVVETIGYGQATVRCKYQDDFLRPGGTIVGPVVMALADFATYVAILGRVGPQLQAVTSNLNISFLERPQPGDIIAEAEVIKLGKRLAVGVVEVFSDASDRPVAHATCTYSIPPKS